MQSRSENTIVKEMHIECRPEILFAFFIEPEKMALWLGRYILLEPRIGGALRIDFNGRDVVVGNYVDVIPCERVTLTWGWQDSDVFPPGSSTVEFRLQPQGSGTLLVLTHSGIPAAKLPTHGQGWTYYTERLKQVVCGQDPGLDTFAP